ncbi:MAG: heme-binding protein, partial [Novosphingobium sp.]
MKNFQMLVLWALAPFGVVALAASSPAAAATSPAPPMPYGMNINGDVAQKVMTAAEAEAAKNNWRMTFAIVDTSGNLIMFKMMTNANFITRDVAIRKARTAAAFRVPTKSLADAARAATSPTITQLLPEYLALEGGVPIVVGGQIIGAIGASGARSYEDAQAAIRGIEA